MSYNEQTEGTPLNQHIRLDSRSSPIKCVGTEHSNDKEPFNFGDTELFYIWNEKAEQHYICFTFRAEAYYKVSILDRFLPSYFNVFLKNNLERKALSYKLLFITIIKLRFENTFSVRFLCLAWFSRDVQYN